MANVKFPTSKPSDKDGLTKRGVDGNPESNVSNVGGPKGAKVIGNATDGSAGKLKTYKTSIKSLNTGEIQPRGDAKNLTDRNDL